MSKLQFYQDDFVLLLESGFIAAGQTDEDAALKLFRAAQLLNQESHLPKVGFGYVHLLKLELKQACRLFDEVLKVDPNNHMAQALLGMSTALTVKESEKGEKILEETLKKANDPFIKNMAQTGLDFIETFIKKQPTPVQSQPKSSSKAVRSSKKGPKNDSTS